MMIRSTPVRLTRIYTKKALKKGPVQHFALGLAKTTVGSSFVEMALHHHFPDMAIVVSDASVMQAVSTIAWLAKEFI